MRERDIPIKCNFRYTITTVIILRTCYSVLASLVSRKINYSV